VPFAPSWEIEPEEDFSKPADVVGTVWQMAVVDGVN
jgi:hypothetical protein